MSADLVSVAQYLRMSTEHQQYSLENQSATIAKYAASHGFEIIRTYTDAARSGVRLKCRTGLRELLQDVVGGGANFRAVLVYDVSRWGRFQDTDESAHYEFLCKSAGVPVHYCAETFANDGSLPSLIMKALKRTMAGEYSRELGVKVLDGQKRLARLGFKQGGQAGYGLRRMLVSGDRHPKALLKDGERKSIATDRVILVPGPSEEVEVVRDIFQMYISDGLSLQAIADRLNREGVKAVGAQWNAQAVYKIVTHPKYAGCHVFGRTSCRLYTPSVKRPESEWILAPKAFEPIVDETTFKQVKRILSDRTANRSDDQLLDALRVLLAKEGRLSGRLIDRSPDLPATSTYCHRFGGLRRAYELIGYGRPEEFGPIDLRSRTRTLRNQLMETLDAMFKEVSVVRGKGRWRSRLRLRNGLIASVLVARSIKTVAGPLRWQVDPVKRECKHITLLARLDAENQDFHDFHVLPNVDRKRRFRIRAGDPWLGRGLRLGSLSDFRAALARVRRGTTQNVQDSR